MSTVTPYLFFPGTCRAALDFYRSCFGGEVRAMTFADAPPGSCAGDMPAARRDQIMHGALTAGAFTLMASDAPDAARAPTGGGVRLAVACTSLDEIEGLFSRLAQGGTVEAPLHDAFWGARFGSLTDRFGIGWMLTFERARPHAS